MTEWLNQTELIPLFYIQQYTLICNICFSLSDLLYSMWWTQGPSISLQMVQFHLFLDRVIFCCIAYMLHLFYPFLCQWIFSTVLFMTFSWKCYTLTSAVFCWSWHSASGSYTRLWPPGKGSWGPSQRLLPWAVMSTYCTGDPELRVVAITRSWRGHQLPRNWHS